MTPERPTPPSEKFWTEKPEPRRVQDGDNRKARRARKAIERKEKELA